VEDFYYLTTLKTKTKMTISKPIKDMTPDEVQSYIDKINEDFRYFIDVAPFVEIGDTSNGQAIRIRAGNVHSGNYSIFEIIFELQHTLWVQQQRNPDIKKLIVSELSLTPEMSQDGFNPVRGLMIRVYYLKQDKSE
jgi:hypothetical protein